MKTLIQTNNSSLNISMLESKAYLTSSSTLDENKHQISKFKEHTSLLLNKLLNEDNLSSNTTAVSLKHNITQLGVVTDLYISQVDILQKYFESVSNQSKDREAKLLDKILILEKEINIQTNINENNDKKIIELAELDLLKDKEIKMAKSKILKLEDQLEELHQRFKTESSSRDIIETQLKRQSSNLDIIQNKYDDSIRAQEESDKLLKQLYAEQKEKLNQCLVEDMAKTETINNLTSELNTEKRMTTELQVKITQLENDLQESELNNNEWKSKSHNRWSSEKDKKESNSEDANNDCGYVGLDWSEIERLENKSIDSFTSKSINNNTRDRGSNLKTLPTLISPKVTTVSYSTMAFEWRVDRRVLSIIEINEFGLNIKSYLKHHESMGILYKSIIGIKLSKDHMQLFKIEYLNNDQIVETVKLECHEMDLFFMNFTQLSNGYDINIEKEETKLNTFDCFSSFLDYTSRMKKTGLLIMQKKGLLGGNKVTLVLLSTHTMTILPVHESSQYKHIKVSLQNAKIIITKNIKVITAKKKHTTHKFYFKVILDSGTEELLFETFSQESLDSWTASLVY